MKTTKNSSRSENAQNEARDSQGRFTSNSNSNSSSNNHRGNSRGENSHNEARDSHGRFTSENNNSTSHRGPGRPKGSTNRK